ncbi:serine-rich coiled-coil domain-containing protein 2 isoform X2 [Paroedura picta]|uniref:serine-rich coiled-coil domain-containing protein 2 isoform X2 n=1 Tax=Paroedura picta TaxID=143630 RepID=UPI004057021F
MEEKNPVRASLVSRLPKYGTKPVGSILQTIPNGTALNLSGNTQSVDKNLSKHNGTLRMSSFSFNWRKSSKYPLGDQISSEPSSCHDPSERLTDSDKCPQSQGTAGKELRIGLHSTSSQTGKQSSMFVSSAEELSQKSLPGQPRSAKFTKSSLLGRTLYSGLNAPRSHLNGICGPQATVDLQRIRGNSTTTRSSSGESLSKSTDNVKSSCEKMVRSQSFSHSIQKSLLPPASLTRSHSFNRAVDLTRPYQNQHLAIRTSQRSNLLSRNARQLEIPNGNKPLRYGLPRSYTTLGTLGVKKPPLSNGSGDAPSLKFRAGRPSLLKPSNQHLGRGIPVYGSSNNDTEKCLEDSSSISVNIHGDTDVKGTQNSKRQEVSEIACNLVEDGGKVICTDGDVDEISISSLSSSDKNDLSEDFSDDFVDLDYRNRTLRIQEEEVSDQQFEYGNEIPLDQLLSLKENERSNCNSDEWLDIRVSVDDKSESAKHPSGTNVISSDMDYRAGSSFELSPSDSSDGTYMWDEEGLEPIGNVHPCGSYDSSEMNSIDILNNLDSCDLEDDDLMLDVDLPEDAPCDNVDYENMNRYERPERNIRQQKEGLWKRTPQRWTTQEHYHLGHTDHYHHGRNDLNRTSNYLDSPPVGHLEGYGAPCLYPPFMGLPPNTVMLDEMTLRHMVQDCTTVKAQLLKMKRILNQNDENVSLHNITLSLPPSPDPQEPEPIYKTDDLLSEITQLKEDLKKKDETIRRLEHRLSVQCNCSKDSPKSEVVGCKYADKYTQTASRKNAPQVLQPSSHLPRFTDLAQGKIIKTSHIAAHSEHPGQDQQRKRGHEYQNAADGSFTRSLNEPSTLSIQLKKPEENMHSVKNVNAREEIGEPAGRKISMPQPHPSSLQSSTQLSTQEVQARLIPKKHRLRTNQASLPKTSKLTKPSNQNDLVPLPAALAAASPEDCSAPKEPELLPPNGPSQLQLASSQMSMNSKNQRTSKLRPPTVSVRPRQTTNLKLPVPPEPQNTWSKASRLKPPTQAKENMQNPSPNTHSGDSGASNWHSRLPKPKTY